MYEAHFGFIVSPFNNIPDPEFLFLSDQHRRALSTLQYALIARAGFCVITGNVGAGKTTLVRNVLTNLDQPIEIGLVSNTKCESFDEFLQWILLAFGLEYKDKSKVEMYDDFVTFLITCHAKDRPVTLIIDEAQHLGAEYLEQLRMLSNINTEKGQILQTILVGQPELWELLKKPELRQFAQRICYDYVLSSLQNEDECRDYINYRIEKAGGEPTIFDKDVFEMVWRATGGVPRLINVLCDTALVYAYGQDDKTVCRQLMEQVVADKETSFLPIGKRQITEPPIVAQLDSSDQLLHTKSRRNMSTIEKAALREREKR